ncbi:gas vesicle accessory protein GvpU [Mesorhizobium sp. CA5]|uniref:gas vesicle accessory protein GvpU n=1 Tax=Mesorhizobium sp. CA5 TaxID=2876638 RepID=UPI001CD0EDCD|nr:gas vesicle accessory protein GvpU [Mesorhizobium sp. CA5]MBZ9843987.1 hypothetical protein [Mesorhizobium sp. CA5]
MTTAGDEKESENRTDKSGDSDVPPVGPANDWFLQSLVDMVNTGGMTLKITLTVGGSLVSGELTSGKQYFEEFGKAVADGLREKAPDLATQLAELYASHGDLYISDPDDSTPKTPPNFIHLKNAHIYFGPSQPIPVNEGAWWRGRICEVQGFLMGTLTGDE